MTHSLMSREAREIQANNKETGPLSPEQLREAYRLYAEDHGKVGAARRMNGKRLFSR